MRAHLGVETQRQWSDRAIARTTPILMGLFSWTTLAAHLMQEQRPMSHRTAAWYAKPSSTFVGCHRSGAPPLVASVGGFFTVRRRTGYMESPGCPVPPTCRFTRLRGLKCAKPSQIGCRVPGLVLRRNLVTGLCGTGAVCPSVQAQKTVRVGSVLAELTC